MEQCHTPDIQHVRDDDLNTVAQYMLISSCFIQDITYKMGKSWCSLPLHRRENLQSRTLNVGISIASLSVAIAALNIVLVHLSYTPQNTHRQVEEVPRGSKPIETVCLDCGQIITRSPSSDLTELVVDQLDNRKKDHHSQCCFNNTDQMIILIGLLTDNTKEDPLAPDPDEGFKTPNVAIHKKLFQATDGDSKLLGDHVRLTFDVNNLPLEYTNGVTVTPYSLVIQFSGLYYIYFSISVHATDNTNEKTYIAAYVHSESLDNNGNTGVLLKSVHNAFPDSTKTIFTGGLFPLKEGNKVEVYVTNSDAIDFKIETTYIGMFLLTANGTFDDGMFAEHGS